MSESTSDDPTDLWFEHRTPEMAGAWRSFHDSVYETATLERSVQELIAAASGAVLRCRHCTRSHIEKAQEEGASQEEIAEALMVAALMGSGTQLYWMRDDYEEMLGDETARAHDGHDGGEDGPRTAGADRTTGGPSTAEGGSAADTEESSEGETPWFAALTEEMGAQWRRFHAQIYRPSALDRRTKELIATACGALLRCRHCTRSHVEKAREHGAEKSHVAEALMTASLIASGAQLAWMMDDYQELLG